MERFNGKIGSGGVVHSMTKSVRLTDGNVMYFTACGSDHATNRSMPVPRALTAFDATKITCKKCLKRMQAEAPSFRGMMRQLESVGDMNQRLEFTTPNSAVFVVDTENGESVSFENCTGWEYGNNQAMGVHQRVSSFSDILNSLERALKDGHRVIWLYDLPEEVA